VTGPGVGGSAGGADSFGTPWAGRALTAQPFAGDDGTADPALEAALRSAPVAGCERVAGSESTAMAGASASADRAVVHALAGARILVAVRAVIGDEHPLPSHDRGDAGADMGLALLTGADGRRALPVFSAVASLAAWDSDARPVPVETARAAQAAVAEGCEAMVLDAAGPVPFVVRRAALWALAQGRVWQPAAEDPQVLAAVEAAVAGVPQVRAVRCEPGERADLRVVLGIEPGLSPAVLSTVLADVQSALSADELVAERADSLEITVLPA